ncbi:MAG: type I methionyl aminopeptidase [Chloroflexota bacterium]|nr:MAG: type I methionyl aminopeptidase [Chloroflexota bacterium]
MSTNTSHNSGITIKSSREIDLMREVGKVVAEAKAAVREAIKPGVSGKELDVLAEEKIRSLGAIPSFKGYKPSPSLPPFPATICFSLNEEIVHGIPGDRVVNEGDLVSVDFGAILNGFHGDSAFTVGVGNVSQESQSLIDSTRISLEQGIGKAVPGGRMSDISHAVQTYAEGCGFSVVREYVGHGIGRSLHEEPQVPNYTEIGPGHGTLLKAGMVIAIEPMLNVGTWKTKILKDDWTVVTEDGELSAHFEHTVAITDNGPEILT